MAVLASPLAHDRLAALLPLPWAKGVERLNLTLTADNADAGAFTIRAYDFAEYRARQGSDPVAPHAIVFPTEGTLRIPVTLTFRLDGGSGARRLSRGVGSADRTLVLDAPVAGTPPFELQVGEEVVRVVTNDPAELEVDRGLASGVAARPHPAGTPVRRRVPGPAVTLAAPAGLAARESLAFPTPAPASQRLLSLSASPAGAVTGVLAWGVALLIGNAAKLAWVLGREKDDVRRLFGDVARSRQVASATGRSLDRIGKDLRVPRFPPRPHPVDDATLALLHLDDTPAAAAPFADAVTAFRPPGNPAENRGVVAGTAGRFGGGVRVGSPGGLAIPDDPALATGPGADLTAELFVRLEAPAGPFAVLLAKAAHDAAGALTGAGWSLGLGAFRGIEANPRFALSDGVVTVAVFADRTLAPGVWHHVAGVLERAAGRASIAIDGREVAAVVIDALGDLSNARDVEIGAVDGGVGPVLAARAVLDEVRLSSVARRHFGPATGEADAAYRVRLALFRRWWRPSPEGLTEALNGAGPVAGDPQPFVVNEQDVPVAIANGGLRILPAEVPIGEALSADGRRNGPPPTADDPQFAAWMLTQPRTSPALSLGGPGARRMQVLMARRIEALSALTAADPSPLEVVAAERPGASPLAAVGREVEVRHPDVAPPRLAALAHQVGVTQVATGADSVTLREPPAARLGLLSEAGPVEGTDLIVGDLLPFRLDPAPGAGARTEWSVVPGAAGRAAIESHPADGADGPPPERRPRIGLRALAPGIVALRGEIERGGVRISAVARLRVGLDMLPDGREIDAEGRLGDIGSLAEPAAAPAFAERFLHRHDPLSRFGAEPAYGNDAMRRMLFPLRTRFDALLALLAAAGEDIADLTVSAGFDPASAPAFAQGRALVISHATVVADRLAAMAHNVGFPLVRHSGGAVTVIAEAAPVVGIEVAGTGDLLPATMAVGDALDLVASLPADAAGRDLAWDIGGDAPLPARTGARSQPTCKLSALRAGRVGIRLVVALREGGKTRPYGFSVRLKPVLDVPGTIIPKDVYDAAMNVLSHFGPIGVEIDTADLRARVVELQDGPGSQLPRYTFPDFKGI